MQELRIGECTELINKFNKLRIETVIEDRHKIEEDHNNDEELHELKLHKTAVRACVCARTHGVCVGVVCGMWE